MTSLDLHDFIENLRTSIIPDTQIDIYRNRIILMQVFKSSDVIKWGWNLVGLDENGIVISLVFNSQKALNEENYRRFKSLECYNTFEKKDTGGGDMYFVFDNRNSNELSFLGDLLNEVYELENDEIEIYLNSYTA